MKTLAFCLICLLAASPAAYADGGFIAPAAFAKVQIPDQRALIHFDAGTETLVIDTSFKGEGTNFAWVVPVPSVPKVGSETTGLFPTLQTIFQPEITHNVDPYFWLAIVAGIFLFHLSWRIRHREYRGWAVISPIAEVVFVWIIMLLLVLMILPFFVTAGVNSSSAGGVNVVERKRVGIYDTAVLSSPDGGALLDWLGKNGFATPTNFLPPIQQYAKEGWFFVASKISLDASMPDSAKPTPLALTFKTDRPVYPLRLTGIGNEACQIDLYIFGPQKAESLNFAVERCAKPLYPKEQEDSWRWGLDILRIRHPGLRKLVDQSPVATKLTARLTSQQMKEDAYITWTPFEEKRLSVYSAHGAAILTTNITIPFLAAVLLITYWSKGRAAIWAQRIHQAGAVAILAVALSWPAIYFSLPEIPVILQRFPSMRNMRMHESELPAYLEYVASGKGTNFTPDLAWVHEQLRENSKFRREIEPEFQTNFFTGQPWREEDSPGNCTVRKTATGLEYTWYDIEGGDHTVTLLFK